MRSWLVVAIQRPSRLNVGVQTGPTCAFCGGPSGRRVRRSQNQTPPNSVVAAIVRPSGAIATLNTRAPGSTGMTAVRASVKPS